MSLIRIFDTNGSFYTAVVHFFLSHPPLRNWQQPPPRTRKGKCIFQKSPSSYHLVVCLQNRGLCHLQNEMVSRRAKPIAMETDQV